MRGLSVSSLRDNALVQKLQFSSSHTRLYAVILTVALVAGVGTGYVLARGNTQTTKIPSVVPQAAKSAQSDTRTFRDFAEGKIEKKPEPKNQEVYSEGTHMLIRDKAVPVALTSSVVDLSLYEGKFVKVYGETQKAIKEGWLMDVGKVEEKK
ncbi:hypothetical protein HYW46_05520 [Candidatus Daviesbacteria bacterium]|nr:hypothetical protein [Candidatus Daviesbacteria bacterium]